MPGEGAAKVGRHLPNAAESLLWTQRIEKEEHYNARQNPKYSVRNAVSVLDVPGNFKPGHVDPSKDRGLHRFDPAENGWDPEGPDAREFRRCMQMQTAGPQDRQAYPMTSAQEHGWLLASRGSPEDRVRRTKNRMGIGWENKHPSDWSESTALPPPVYTAASSGGGRSEGAAAAEARHGDGGGVAEVEASSRLSAAVPLGGHRSLSLLSAAAPLSVLTNSPPSQVSRVVPTELSGVSDGSISALSRATSLPAINEHPADRLYRQERRLGRAFKESSRYLNRGDRGSLYARPLGTTDATKFDDEFTKAAGMPLYKYAKRT